jgi:hypothetical protein
MYKILFRLIFTALSFVGTFMGVFMVMVSALLNLNEVEPIDPTGNAMLIICAVIASFSVSISIISNINNFISEK